MIRVWDEPIQIHRTHFQVGEPPKEFTPDLRYEPIEYGIWLVASTASRVEARGAMIKPMQEVLPSAKPFVTDRVQILLDALSELLTRAARRYGIPIQRIEVSGYVDPEEDFKQVVVTQLVNLPAEEALAYWDKLGLMIADWEKNLPDSFAPVMENIAVEVDWNVRTSAVQSA